MSIKQKTQMSQKSALMIAFSFASGVISKAAALDLLVGCKNMRPDQAAAFLGVRL